MGGNFRDGMANSLLGSLAGEVGQQLNAHINQLQVTHGLNASEVSALRLLSRAASSGDAAAGFAVESWLWFYVFDSCYHFLFGLFGSKVGCSWLLEGGTSYQKYCIGSG